MGMESVLFNFWNSTEKIVKIINKWEPKKFKTEKQYENSLYDLLHEKLEEVSVIKQYAQGRVSADIVVGEKVLIELKNNLNSRSEYQRMLGQLDEYNDNWKGHIILILCGKTEPSMRKEIKAHIKKKFPIDKLTVIEKTGGKKKKKEKGDDGYLNWF